MTIQELNQRRKELRNEVDILVSLKKKLYSNMDIETPMSKEEKELNAKISKIFSEINSIIIKIRKLS